MMYFPLLLLLLFFSPFQQVVAQSDETAAFVVPDNWAAGRKASDRPVYQVGSILEVEWTTTDDEYRIILCHITNLTSFSSSRGSTFYSKARSDKETKGFNWTVDQQTFSLNPNVFFLAFQPLDTTLPLNESAYSQYFNLTNEAVSTSTASSTRTSASISSTSATPSSTAPPPQEPTSLGSSPEPSATSTSTSSSTPSPSSSGLSSGASIGLGVGVGIGGVATIILAYLAFVRYRKRKAKGAGAGTAQPYHLAPSAYNDHGHDGKPIMAMYGGPAVTPQQQGHMYQYPSEMPAQTPTQTPMQSPHTDFTGSDTSSQMKFGQQRHVSELPAGGQT